eukprot:1103089-Pelagomonas_calceolata.AAC.1
MMKVQCFCRARTSVSEERLTQACDAATHPPACKVNTWTAAYPKDQQTIHNDFAILFHLKS